MNSDHLASSFLLLFLFFSIDVPAQTVLLPEGSVWQFLDNGSNLGVAWTRADYDASSWQTGQAPLGYGDGDEATTVNYGADRFEKHLTTYFLKSIIVTNAEYITNLNLRLLRDDGAVVYINGIEVLRNNLPSGPITYLTPALNELSFPQEHARVFAAVDEPLHNGTNIVAVEIHQTDGASADISFDLGITAGLAPSGQPVVISQPADNSYYRPGETVFFTARLRGIGNSVARVAYYSGGDFIGESAIAPFRVGWSGDAGSYLVTAVAFLQSNTSATSPPVRLHVTANSPPEVRMLYPPTDSEWRSGVGVPLNANATDPDSTIAKVRFYEGTNFIEEDTTFFYAGTWTPASIGEFFLYAVAEDTHGNIRTSAPVRVTVVTNYVPFVRIISPGNNTVFPIDTMVEIKPNTSDRDGQIVQMDYFLNNSLVAQSFAPPFSASFWQEAIGEFTLTARAYDNSGLSSTSSPVLLTFLTPTFPEISRGPYLQSGTSNSIIIKWRTDSPTDSKVQFGLGSVSGEVFDFSLKTNHSVQLSGLAPDTRYFYTVGKGNEIFGAGNSFSFVTSPIETKPFRVWVLGDSGTANQNARDVRDAFYQFSESTPDLWLMLGDNAYNSGQDFEYQVAVFDMYRPTLRSSVLWPTIGNHDASLFAFPYLDIFTLPTHGQAGGVPSGTEKYYAFDYANVHFVCLDSVTTDPSENGAMCTWLRQDLNANDKQWLVAFWHYPPYSKGSHDSDTEADLGIMRTNVVPILEEYGVDLVLTGHSHSYERSYLLHGHYGTSETFGPHHIRRGGSGRVDAGGPYLKAASEGSFEPGAVYVVAGSSGQKGGGPLNYPAMYTSLDELGSLVLDFDGDVLNAYFLQPFEEVSDSFTMVKPSQALTITEFNLDRAEVSVTWKSLPGTYYTVEMSEDVAGPDWLTISQSIYAVSSTTTWRGTVPSLSDSVFLRIKAW